MLKTVFPDVFLAEDILYMVLTAGTGNWYVEEKPFFRRAKEETVESR